jgi:23S rRNA (adenine2030-N6)-methyltransferase
MSMDHPPASRRRASGVPRLARLTSGAGAGGLGGSYLHGYHAGNFADVVKHILLTRLIEHLKQKEKPFFVLDTHAGCGRYDLRSGEVRQSGEAPDGIGRLAAAGIPWPALLTPYREALRAVNEGKEAGWRYYPGSPSILATLLRPEDRLYACEIQSRECRLLGRTLKDKERAAACPLDGYQAVRTYLPPVERRGLVFLDPPFERPGEFQRLEAALLEGVQRFQSGMFALWYPIKDARAVDRFHRALQATGIPQIHVAEMCVLPPDNPRRLNGTGLVVVNPPWTYPEEASTILAYLTGRLAQSGPGQWRAWWLTP